MKYRKKHTNKALKKLKARQNVYISFVSFQYNYPSKWEKECEKIMQTQRLNQSANVILTANSHKTMTFWFSKVMCPFILSHPKLKLYFI